MSDLNKIAILILNYNSCSLTISNVNQLLKLNENLNIVIVDNCSTDNSYIEFINIYKRNNNIRILKNTKNNGYAAGNNFGLKYIKENLRDVEYAVIMNPDIFVSTIDVFLNLLEALQKNKDISVISGSIIFNHEWRAFLDFGWKLPSYKTLCFSGTLIGKLLNIPVNELYSNCLISNNLIKVDVVPGCFFMTKISDLEKVGWFDESTFLYYEETILAKKLQRIGKGEAILLDNLVYHNHEIKDKNVKNIKHRIFDRRCFHNSKMVYIRGYSGMNHFQLTVCIFINKLDFYIKQMVFRLQNLKRVDR